MKRTLETLAARVAWLSLSALLAAVALGFVGFFD